MQPEAFGKPANVTTRTFARRFDAWSNAVLAMNDAILRGEQRLWVRASAAWSEMAGLHLESRDHQIYADLAEACARHAFRRTA